MKIAIVTTYPPSKGSLNEYGFHFTRGLLANAAVDEVVLLTDEPESPVGQLGDRLRSVPAWSFGSLRNTPRLVAAVRRERPDAVIFNIQFATFGSGRVSAALGLLSVAAVRATGVPTIAILHNPMDTIDLTSAGFKMGGLMERIVRLSGRMVTRAILMADLVAVTIPTYVDLLAERYGAKNVVLSPHGSFEMGEHLSHETVAGTPGGRRILAFGKFGTYKRVEVLFEAQRILHAANPETRVIIAGQDSPNAPGYLAEMAARYADVPGIEFTGYVAEEDVARVFRASDVVVFPYTSTTGSSGVLHQAGEHACAVVLPDLGDLAELVREEGYQAEIFAATDPEDLARAIERVLSDTAYKANMGATNRAVSAGLPIADVADWHLIHIDELRRAKSRAVEAFA